MRKFGYGSPELLREITEKRVAAIELKIDQRITTAMGRARAKLDALPVAQRKGAESTIVKNEIERIFQEQLAENRLLWADAPKDMPVGVERTRQIYRNIIEDLAVAQRGDVPSILKNNPIIKATAKEGEELQTTLREMQGLRSKLLEQSRMARKSGQWNRARIADDVADAILEDLDVISEGSVPLRAALAHTKQMKMRFESGIVGNIRGYAKSGAPAIDPTLTLDVSIGRQAEKGAVDIGKIAITPDAIAATERYLGRSFTDYALDKKTGTINPMKAGTWVKTNEAILDQFPNLRTQLTDATEAQAVANKTNALMVARKKALRDPKISVSAEFLNAADMGKEVDTIFKSANPTRMTVELVRQARKDATGQALEGLKSGMVDYMLDKSYIGAFNEIGEQTLSGRTLLNFITRNETALREAFSAENIIRMRRVGTEFAKIEAFEKTTFGKPDIELSDLASTGLQLFGRIAGARIGGIWGRESAGGSLQMAQIFSGKAKGLMLRLSKDKAEQMIKDAILSKDPKLLQALLLPIDKPGLPATEKNMRILNERMNLWLAGTGRRVMDDILEEKKMDTEPTRSGR